MIEIIPMHPCQRNHIAMNPGRMNWFGQNPGL